MTEVLASASALSLAAWAASAAASARLAAKAADTLAAAISLAWCAGAPISTHQAPTSRARLSMTPAIQTSGLNIR